MTKIARYYQITGLGNHLAQQMSSLQPDAKIFTQVQAIDFSKLSPAQQQVLVDRQALSHYELTHEDHELSRVISHYRLLQQIAYDDSIADHEVVVVIEDGMLLTTSWYRHVNQLVGFFNTNPDLKFVALSNDLKHDFYTINEQHGLERIGVITEAKFIIQAEEYDDELYLAFIKQLKLNLGKAYLIRKSAILERMQNLVSISDVLAGNFNSPLVQNKANIGWPMSALHELFPFSFASIAVCTPVQAVKAFDDEGKFLPVGNFINNIFQVRNSQLNSHQLFLTPELEKQKLAAEYRIKTLPEVWQNHLYRDNLIDNPLRGPDFLKNIPKFVLTDQGFDNYDQQNQLTNFYWQANTEDFLPIVLPSKEDPELQELIKNSETLRSESNITVSRAIHPMRMKLALERLYDRIADDKTLRDNDFVLIARENLIFQPNWYSQLNRYLNMVSIYVPETKCLVLEHPAVKDFSSYSLEQLNQINLRPVNESFIHASPIPDLIPRKISKLTPPSWDNPWACLEGNLAADLNPVVQQSLQDEFASYQAINPGVVEQALAKTEASFSPNTATSHVYLPNVMPPKRETWEYCHSLDTEVVQRLNTESFITRHLTSLAGFDYSKHTAEQFLSQVQENLALLKNQHRFKQLTTNLQQEAQLNAEGKEYVAPETEIVEVPFIEGDYKESQLPLSVFWGYDAKDLEALIGYNFAKAQTYNQNPLLLKQELLKDTTELTADFIVPGLSNYLAVVEQESEVATATTQNAYGVLLQEQGKVTKVFNSEGKPLSYFGEYALFLLELAQKIRSTPLDDQATHLRKASLQLQEIAKQQALNKQVTQQRLGNQLPFEIAIAYTMDIKPLVSPAQEIAPVVTANMNWEFSGFDLENRKLVALHSFNYFDAAFYMIRVGCLRSRRHIYHQADYAPNNFQYLCFDDVYNLNFATPVFAFTDDSVEDKYRELHSEQNTFISGDTQDWQRQQSAITPKANVPDYVSSMPKFLVNLPQQTERLEFMLAQPGLDKFTVVPAVYGKDFTDEEKAKEFDLEKFSQICKRLPVPGEYGCTMSHVNIYRQVLADDSIADEQWVLISEDDSSFSPDWQDQLNKLLHHLKTKKLDQLELILGAHIFLQDLNLLPKPKFAQTDYLYIDESNPEVINSDQTLFYLKQFYPHGSSCYLVKKSALKKKMAQIDKPWWVADDFVCFVDFKPQNYAVMNPPLSKQNMDLFSTIALDRVEEVNKSKEALKKIPLYDSAGEHIQENKFVLQVSDASLAEIEAKFPGYRIVPKVKHKELSPEQFAAIYDVAGFEELYGVTPSEEEIDRALTHFAAYKMIASLNTNKIKFCLIVEDTAEIVPDLIQRISLAVRYIDTRLQLSMRLLALSNDRVKDPFQFYTVPELQAQDMKIEESDYNPINPEAGVYYCNSKGRTGAAAYVVLNRHVITDVIEQHEKVFWLYDDFPRFFNFFTNSFLYHNPCLVAEENQQSK